MSRREKAERRRRIRREFFCFDFQSSNEIKMKAYHLTCLFLILIGRSSSSSPSKPCRDDLPRCCPTPQMALFKNSCVKNHQQQNECPSNSIKEKLPICSSGDEPVLIPYIREPEVETVMDGLKVVSVETEDQRRLTTFIEDDSTPNAFCFPNDDEKQIYGCPEAKLDKSQIRKCCEFGERLSLPLFKGSGCEKQSDSEKWILRVNGQPIPLKDLIQFPYENVVYKGQSHLHKNFIII